ncbi:hypothetical protein [Pueribacillus sp. YX66]|uniref:hypothetical protein n=1 Tax=Pueribacillus sp. YX66 TaxID=3229242 RepID=UPI00358D2E75
MNVAQLAHQGKTLSNAKLNQKAYQLAHRLKNMSIRDQERVLVILLNLPDVLISY